MEKKRGGDGEETHHEDRKEKNKTKRKIGEKEKKNLRPTPVLP